MIFLPKSGIRRIPRRLRRSHRRQLLASDWGRIGLLNAALADVEAWIIREADAQRAAFCARLAEGDPQLTDFELEAVVTFYLRRDDPKWADDQDNILITLAVCLVQADGGRDWPLPMPDEVSQALGATPMTELLYTLLEYGDFWLADLCRVGTVWADVVATAQKIVEIGE